MGVEFFHADIRQFWDLDSLPGDYDLMIEASAEPSVHAGNDGSPRYVLDTNLNGALNCWEFARKRCGFVVFLSTSRVYSIPHLQSLPLLEGKNGYSLSGSHRQGFSEAGIAEDFPIDGYRSLYGSTKLAGEMFLEEYGEAFGLNYVINRCGVLAGPGQFGRVDQGVYTLWVAHHLYGKPLSYTGFGGTGLQVRDLLHPEDLARLIELQIQNKDRVRGQRYNVGGGVSGSVSLRELTNLCEEATGRKLEIRSSPATAKVDIPYYVSDCAKVRDLLAWSPKYSPRQIISQIANWLDEGGEPLRTLFES